MSNKHKSRNERRLAKFTESSVRIERIVSFSTEPDLSVLSDAAVAVIEDVCQVISETGLPDCSSGKIGDEDDAEEVARWIVDDLKATGFFVQAAHPKYEPSAVGLSGGFGLYNTRWFYADTVDAALNAALTWGKQREAEAWKRVEELSRSASHTIAQLRSGGGR